MSIKVAVCENGHYLGQQDTLAASEKFCPCCGAKILRECPNCGAFIRENLYIFNSEYCSSCGKKYPWWANEEYQPPRQYGLAMETEKKLMVTKDISIATM